VTTVRAYWSCYRGISSSSLCDGAGKTCLFASRLLQLAAALGGIKHGDSWRVECGGERFKRTLFFVLILTIHSVHDARHREAGNRMSLGDALLNRQMFFGRAPGASVSTLYYNIYGTVSTFSWSPCGWEVSLFVPFSGLPWHSLESPVFVYVFRRSRDHQFSSYSHQHMPPSLRGLLTPF